VKYAKYRWDYAPQAVEEIFQRTGLGSESVVADIGSGTGILTRHFCGRVGQIFAIEPNREMRLEASRQIAQWNNVKLIDAPAEATTLEDHSIHLVTVAQAIHWFEPVSARHEFLRILKPNGWLALLRNNATGDQQFAQAMAEICTPAYGVQPVHAAPANHISPTYYFGHENAYRAVFPFSFEQDWEEFIGSICSASYMPDEGHPLFPKFESAAHKIFDNFCRDEDGLFEVTGETELIIGLPV